MHPSRVKDPEACGSTLLLESQTSRTGNVENPLVAEYPSRRARQKLQYHRLSGELATNDSAAALPDHIRSEGRDVFDCRRWNCNFIGMSPLTQVRTSSPQQTKHPRPHPSRLQQVVPQAFSQPLCIRASHLSPTTPVTTSSHVELPKGWLQQLELCAGSLAIFPLLLQSQSFLALLHGQQHSSLDHLRVV